MRQADSLLIGTAGVPHSAKSEGTVGGLKRLAELGLDAMELEYVRGTFPGENTARAVAQAAGEHGIRLTAHGPYYINLNAVEPDKREASRKRVMNTARIGSLSGAESITFHAGFFLGQDTGVVFDTISSEMRGLVKNIREHGFEVDVRPELTGKATQFGSLDEILALSSGIDGVEPCIDWSHLHARTGAFNSVPEIQSVLDTVRDRLGGDALKSCHMHVSGIEFTAKGERKHLDLTNADYNYRALLDVLADNGVCGFLICESPSLEDDALVLKEYYDRGR